LSPLRGGSVAIACGEAAGSARDNLGSGINQWDLTTVTKTENARMLPDGLAQEGAGISAKVLQDAQLNSLPLFMQQ
jgi:hypothetical protein